MWFIIGMVVVLIVIGLFVRVVSIEDEDIRNYNKRVNNIDPKYDNCQFGLGDKYKDSVFHAPDKMNED